MVMVDGNTYIVENIYSNKIHNIENGFITLSGILTFFLFHLPLHSAEAYGGMLPLWHLEPEQRGNIPLAL